MGLEDKDIVYCVKDNPVNEELRYSLRSLKNIPHKDVFIVGGCPDWVNLDTVKHIPITQDKGNKWTNTAFSLKMIVNNPDISDDFIWFNDDFFVLKEIKELPYYYDRTLLSRVADFSKLSWMAMSNRYCSRLKNASRALKMSNRPTLNYELHIPVIFNKERLKWIMDNYLYVGAKRSLYCNNFVEGAIKRPDVKIYTNDNIPTEDWDFVSTSDDSFRQGDVGKYLRKKFHSKCIYEK